MQEIFRIPEAPSKEWPTTIHIDFAFVDDGFHFSIFEILMFMMFGFSECRNWASKPLAFTWEEATNARGRIYPNMMGHGCRAKT